MAPETIGRQARNKGGICLCAGPIRGFPEQRGPPQPALCKPLLAAGAWARIEACAKHPSEKQKMEIFTINAWTHMLQVSAAAPPGPSAARSFRAWAVSAMVQQHATGFWFPGPYPALAAMQIPCCPTALRILAKLFASRLQGCSHDAYVMCVLGRIGCATVLTCQPMSAGLTRITEVC